MICVCNPGETMMSGYFSFASVFGAIWFSLGLAAAVDAGSHEHFRTEISGLVLFFDGENGPEVAYAFDVDVVGDRVRARAVREFQGHEIETSLRLSTKRQANPIIASDFAHYMVCAPDTLKLPTVVRGSFFAISGKVS